VAQRRSLIEARKQAMRKPAPWFGLVWSP